jgi:hypothetical protein
MAGFYTPPGLTPEEILLRLRQKAGESPETKSFGLFARKEEEPSEKEEEEVAKKLQDAKPEETA